MHRASFLFICAMSRNTTAQAEPAAAQLHATGSKPQAPELRGPTDRVGHLLRRAFQAAQENSARGFADLGLTPRQAAAVWQIHLGGSLSQRELGEAIGMDAPNVHGLVLRLIKARLRHPGARSGRSPPDAPHPHGRRQDHRGRPAGAGAGLRGGDAGRPLAQGPRGSGRNCWSGWSSRRAARDRAEDQRSRRDLTARLPSVAKLSGAPAVRRRHGTFMNSIVLIADDDPVQRRLLETMIRRFGYEAETVDGGEAALARLEDANQASRLICSSSTSSCPISTAWACSRSCASAAPRRP